MFDITPIIEAILGLLAAIITAIIVPYIKSRTTAEQQAQIDAWVKIGVTAAEQVFTGEGRGDEKKAYVIDFLKKHGYILDDERIDALIESAVFEMKNGILE